MIDIDIDYLARLYESGESVLALSKRFKVSRPAIYYRLKLKNVTLRNASEANVIRMEREGVEGRKRLTEAAHAAVRGRRYSFEEKVKRALSKENAQLSTPVEAKLISLLDAKGIMSIAQKAVGIYNIDVALAEFPIAVEIYGGCWHAHGSAARRFRKRFDYIINAKWIPVIIWVTRDYPLEVGAVEYIVSLVERLRKNKPVRRQEHVIRGDGKPSSYGKSNLDYNAAIGGDKSGDLVRGKDGRFRR